MPAAITGHLSTLSTGGRTFSILGIIIILAPAVAALVWIARELGDRRDDGPAAANSSLESLDRRLVSGEINTEQ